MLPSKSCSLCGSPLRLLTDLGEQPICSRYLQQSSDFEDLFRLSVSICSGCDLVQLSDHPRAHDLRPRVSWIRYSEPEQHLDEVVDRIVALPALHVSSEILGLTLQDDTTLARLEERGFTLQRRFDIARDLGITAPNAGIETIQDWITSQGNGCPSATHADLIVARYILEHAHDASGFLRGVAKLLKPNGYVVFEVPDCTSMFATSDYSFIWEEHTMYFVPRTLVSTLRMAGFEPVWMSSFTPSNALVVAARRSSDVVMRSNALSHTLSAADGRGAYFNLSLEMVATRYQEYLQAIPGRVVLFGAGHVGAKFINFHGLQDLISAVIDDHPEKKALFMPGSRIQIWGSEFLRGQEIPSVCLLAVSSDAEERIIENFASYTAGGGRFLSAIRASSRSVPM